MAATPAASGVVPEAPEVTAQAGDRQATLSWQVSDPGILVAVWQIQQASGSGAYGAWVPIAGSTHGTRSHTVTGLTNGTAYGFRLRGVNARGQGAQSTEVKVTPAATPARPTGLQAMRLDTLVTLSWDDPEDASIVLWQYELTTGGNTGDWVDIPANAEGLVHGIEGLSASARLSFRVRAVGAQGNAGPASDPAVALEVPAAPAGFQATAGDGEVMLAWQDPGDARIRGWQVRYRPGLANFVEKDWQDIPGSRATTTGHTVSGLTNGDLHHFQVRAVSANGNGAATETAEATPSLAVPAAPTGLTATADLLAVALAWDNPRNPSIIRWEFQRATGMAAFTAEEAIPASDAGTTAHNVSGLVAGTAYRFAVRAVNAAGAGAWSETVSATVPKKPAKPGDLRAGAGDGAVALSWRDPGNVTITHWQIQQQVEGGSFGPWSDIPGSDATTRRHLVSGLVNGDEYGFRIRAVNEAGLSPDSDIATATPGASIPLPPAGLTAVPGDAEVTLAWTDVPDPTYAAGSTVEKVWEVHYQKGGSVVLRNGVPVLNPAAWHREEPTADGNQIRLVVKNLTNTVSYTFKVRQVMLVTPQGANPTVERYESGETRTVSARPDKTHATPTPPPPPPAPAAPTGLVARAGDTIVDLSWDDPANTDIASWQIRQREGEGAFDPWQDIADSDATTTRHRVRDLANGVAYGFEVRAVNVNGEEGEADEASATPLGRPEQPVGLTAEARNGAVDLAWTDPEDDSITLWQLRRQVGQQAFGAWTTIGRDPGLASWRADNLRNGIAHGFEIRAVNSTGAGPASERVQATPLATLPPAPGGLAGTGLDGAVALTWTAPAGTVTGYQYRQSADGGATWSGWTATGTDPATLTTFTLGGLENGKDYDFEVRARNGVGFGASSARVTVRTGPPAQPENFRAEAGNGQVALLWDDPRNPTITSWQFQQKTGSAAWGDAWTAIPGSGAATVSHWVTGLDNGTAYTFRLRAVNEAGAGAASEEKSAVPTTPPDRPTGLVITPGDSLLHLAWDDPGDATITGWQMRAAASASDLSGTAWRDVAVAGSDAETHPCHHHRTRERHGLLCRAPGGECQRRQPAGLAAGRAGRALGGGAGVGAGQAHRARRHGDDERRAAHLGRSRRTPASPAGRRGISTSSRELPSRPGKTCCWSTWWAPPRASFPPG